MSRLRKDRYKNLVGYCPFCLHNHGSTEFSQCHSHQVMNGERSSFSCSFTCLSCDTIFAASEDTRSEITSAEVFLRHQLKLTTA